MSIVAEVSLGEYRLVLKYDETAEDPRDWENLGTMICSHRTYHLGDVRAWDIENYKSWDEWLQGEILDIEGEENIIYLPLYLYDHGGLSISTAGASCRWDSGQVGWIFVDKQKLIDETGLFSTSSFDEELAENILRSEVREYHQYISGDVYSATIFKDKECECCGSLTTEIVDSCYGLYGIERAGNAQDCFDDKFDGLFRKLREEG